MSLIEALSSSDAEATLSTLIEASPEAFSATWTRSLVWRETADRPDEVVRIWPEASPSCCSVWRTMALEFADIGLDRALTRGGAGVALALLLLDPAACPGPAA